MVDAGRSEDDGGVCAVCAVRGARCLRVRGTAGGCMVWDQRATGRFGGWRQAAIAEAKETSYKVFEYNTYSTHVFLGYEQVMTPRLLSSHLLLPCAPPSARACVCVLQALKKSSVGSITTRAADERVS